MRKRPVGIWIRAPFRRRTYVRLWRLARIYPAPWRRRFWDPDLQLARQALRYGAAQKIRELTGLIGLLRAHRPRVIVEIGTARGGTLFALCNIAHPAAVIVSIDLPGGNFGGGYSEDEIPRLASFTQAGQTLHFLRRDSHEEETRTQLIALLEGAAVDFLMIDGDHTYDGVKRDFELYSPLVRPRGLIAFHDIVPHARADCQVDRFWADLKCGFDHLEFVDLFDNQRQDTPWGGIGVLTRWNAEETEWISKS
jgi:predicted O-methyltransferase YrrM